MKTKKEYLKENFETSIFLNYVNNLKKHGKLGILLFFNF